ncbi:MAG: DUF805 domain-containing protein [Candidatus Sphingomonas phytovorans]|nr:DUF805 domain-containing protein [Sphingomonas sp.]WEJ99744.1 MAG: DUF805 domain-containing protein [Sphingomonas sp.]
MKKILTRPWRLYADFAGRSQRTEYFMFFIALYSVMALLALFAGVFTRGFNAFGSGGGSTVAMIAMIVLVLLGLAAIIPSWAVTIRRLHDQDKSGWFALLVFIPYIGGLIMIVLAFLPGTPGENDYGFDPRTDEQEDSDRLGDVFS